MSVLKLAMITDQASVNKNRDAMQVSIDALNNTLTTIRAGGEAKAVKRTRDLGKMMVRERIDQLSMLVRHFWSYQHWLVLIYMIFQRRQGALFVVLLRYRVCLV